MDNNVKEIRINKKLSLSTLAKMSGLNPSTIWRIEEGIISPKIITLQKIASALNVNIKELLNNNTLTR